jgi:selenocysteine lyase/cysteine desulfurase
VFRVGEDPRAVPRPIDAASSCVRSGGIRSRHFYNNADDIDRFLAALDALRH